MLTDDELFKLEAAPPLPGGQPITTSLWCKGQEKFLTVATGPHKSETGGASTHPQMHMAALVRGVGGHIHSGADAATRFALTASPDGLKVHESGPHGATRPGSITLEHQATGAVPGYREQLPAAPGIIRDDAGHTSAVKMAEFSNSGTLIVTGGYDAAAILWNRATGKRILQFAHPLERRDLEGHVVRGHAAVDYVAFSPDDAMVATCSVRDLSVRVFAVRDGTLLRKLLSPGLPSGQYLTCPRFSPCGAHLACGDSERSMHTFNLRSGEAIQTFIGHEAACKGNTGNACHVGAVCFSEDGRQLLSGAMDGTARVWDRESGLQVRRFGKPVHFRGISRFGHDGEVCSVSFSPPGGLVEVCVLTASTDGTTRISPLFPSDPPMRHMASTYELSSARNMWGKHVMAAYSDGSVVVWCSLTGNKIGYYEVPDGFRESQFRAAPDPGWVSSGMIAIGRQSQQCREACFQIWLLDDSAAAMHDSADNDTPNIERQGYPGFISPEDEPLLTKGQGKVVCSMPE